MMTCNTLSLLLCTASTHPDLLNLKIFRQKADEFIFVEADPSRLVRHVGILREEPHLEQEMWSRGKWKKSSPLNSYISWTKEPKSHSMTRKSIGYERKSDSVVKKSIRNERKNTSVAPLSVKKIHLTLPRRLIRLKSWLAARAWR